MMVPVQENERLLVNDNEERIDELAVQKIVVFYEKGGGSIPVDHAKREKGKARSGSCSETIFKLCSTTGTATSKSNENDSRKFAQNEELNPKSGRS